MTTIHQDQPMQVRGVSLDKARVAMIMVHGRGASAQDILSMSLELPQDGVAFVAPQAAGNVWYPNRFLAPVASNEPYLTSALDTLDALVRFINTQGIPNERIILLGFSQGASLTLEYAARHPARYGGVVGLSGAMIENGDLPREYSGSFDGTLIFLGCSDADPFIPAQRVLQSEVRLREMGARVTAKLYPNMGHTITEDEIAVVSAMVNKLH